MEFTGKKVMVLGGAGLVGRPICKMAAEENISELVICSLFEHESADFARDMQSQFPGLKINRFWGNIFVRHDLKDIPLADILADPAKRRTMIGDIMEPLNRDILSASAIFRLLDKYKPDIVIDSINTATGIAYQNIYAVSREVVNMFDKRDGRSLDDIQAAVERLLCTQYTPQLIRHVQIFLQSMVAHKTKFYLKIGTCGTGGMGLNIPYTHSEDKPSQMLLSKSAVAGGHSLLMFLMARTPGGPIIKELKPAAAIAWKKVAIGPVKKKGRDVLLEDVGPNDAVRLAGVLGKRQEKEPRYLQEGGRPKTLVAPYIDTGENGLFSLGEFEALTDEGQMEFITPEEIAQCAVWEIKGMNTGHDIVAALDNSTMAPTYRAGYMRAGALAELRKVIKDTGIESVAFEQLGPPRLSKLLYEAHLLKLCYGMFEKVIGTKADQIVKTLEAKLLGDAELRSRIISIGIPILLSDGNQILRGSHMAIPADVPGQPHATFEVTPDRVDKWAHDGWVDLRRENIAGWQARLKKIKASVDAMGEDDTSSFETKGRHYWQDENGGYPIAISKLVSYIFIHEEEGIRMKW
jgi:hypothetical protein